MNKFRGVVKKSNTIGEFIDNTKILRQELMIEYDINKYNL